MKIGEKIRVAREDMDLLQADMANMIPMNQSNYSKIERDLQEPNMYQLKRICQILNLDPRYLLELESLECASIKDIKLLEDIKKAFNKYKDTKTVK